MKLFCNYFRKFIQGYSQLAMPLTDMTRQSVRWDWTEACQSSFEGLKNALSHAPALKIADPKAPYEMVADASGYAIGGVVLQMGHSIAFESMKMNPAERNYTVGEQELLAVIHCLRHWRCYLEKCKGGLSLVTDDKP